MPANAGIQVRFRFKFQNRLDSGFRRNDGNKSRLPVDKSRTLGLEPRVVQFENHNRPRKGREQNAAAFFLEILSNGTLG